MRTSQWFWAATWVGSKNKPVEEEKQEENKDNVNIEMQVDNWKVENE